MQVDLSSLEFNILNAIQNLRSDFLDKFMLVLTDVAGSYGQFWLYLAVLLLIFKKTRRTAVTIVVSYALVYLIGQFALKDLIARVRPCNTEGYTELALLIAPPSSYSCPSTHSAWAFAAATSICIGQKQWGIPAVIVAAVIAFSRLYLFVHFPTDVLFGMVLGIALAFAGSALVNLVWKKTGKA